MCRHRKAKLNVSPGFFLLVTWFGMDNDWQLLMVVLGAALVHELGHWTALRVLGAEVYEIRLSVLGAAMRMDARHLTYGGELVATLAGPAANFLAAFLLITFNKNMLAGAHLVLGIFNLLPIRHLDGGKALYLAAAWAFGPEAGERLVRGVSIMTAGGMAALLMWLMGVTGGSLWLAPAAAGLLAVAWREHFCQ